MGMIHSGDDSDYHTCYYRLQINLKKRGGFLTHRILNIITESAGSTVDSNQFEKKGRFSNP